MTLLAHVSTRECVWRVVAQQRIRTRRFCSSGDDDDVCALSGGGRGVGWGRQALRAARGATFKLPIYISTWCVGVHTPHGSIVSSPLTDNVPTTPPLY